MADDGSGDDIWANTKPESDSGASAAPPPDPGAMPPPDPDATTVQPGAMPPPDPDATTVWSATDGTPPGDVDPTTVQPTIAGAAAAGAAGVAAGAAGPPPEGPPPGDSESEPSGWRPPWLLPALIALLVALVVGLFAVLSSGGGDDSETDATTTSSSDVPPETDPLFVPVDSDGNPATTIADSTTTLAGETTVPPASDPPATDPPTTDPPATDPPATDPPATDPPATDPPATDPPAAIPDPGFASVDGEILEIRVACRVRPTDVGDGEIVSYLVENASGRIVIERWFEGEADGVDVDVVRTRDHASSGPTTGGAVTDPFAATVTGDMTMDVAVNPPAGGLDECLDFVETTVDGGAVTHTYVVLDVCTVGTDVAGIASEGVQFSAIDNGDGTAALTFSDRTSGDLTDPDASRAVEETIVTYIGEVTDGGGDVRSIIIELDLAGLRECADDEKP